jgi:hypothetical protein
MGYGLESGFDSRQESSQLQDRLCAPSTLLSNAAIFSRFAAKDRQV